MISIGYTIHVTADETSWYKIRPEFVEDYQFRREMVNNPLWFKLKNRNQQGRDEIWRMLARHQLDCPAHITMWEVWRVVLVQK